MARAVLSRLKLSAYLPQFFNSIQQGYKLADFRADFWAGLTVAIVALPLAMALAIASGATPEKGLITAIIAGFLISFLGGSRVQIGGPTGAFVVVVFAVIAQHGYDGLVLATMMAGIILLLAGAFGLGTYIKYIPSPVVTGFTAGIAVIIATSQLRDILGLPEPLPADFLHKFPAIAAQWLNVNYVSVMLAVAATATIFILRHHAPKLPAYLIAVVAAALLVHFSGLATPTIGSRFGGVPTHFTLPDFPAISMARLLELLPAAFTIAFLAGVEALLSAVVADGMTGGRHKSNCELVAQGVANCASALVGGLPATGAIARTATNIRAGARTPVAGMLHAILLLLFMWLLAPLMSYIPLAALAAILLVVAYHMSEIERFRHLLSAPMGDRIVLLLTFALTVLADLTVAIEVGVVLAAFLFMHRMAGVVEMVTHKAVFAPHAHEPLPEPPPAIALPAGVVALQIRGPFFFGVTPRLADMLDRLDDQKPHSLILQLRDVPLMDASGAVALSEFVARCRKKAVRVILCGLQAQPQQIIESMGLFDGDAALLAAPNFTVARQLVESL